jgi:cell division septation protein DedD
METKPDKSTKKALAIWGIPIVILIVLVVALVLELTGDKDVDVRPREQTEDVVVRTPESVRIEVTPALEPTQPAEPPPMVITEETGIKPKLADYIGDPEPAAPAVTEETAKPVKAEVDEEEEFSYIVEEGDSLWKIAKKKDVLGDPFQWKTILIQNRDKINYTIFSEETGQWKVMVDAGKRLVIRPQESEKVSTSFDRTRKKRYAVQLMSLNIDQLDRAVDIVKFLIRDGYHAYLYRTREKIKPINSDRAQYFYRIRVGFFETEREALDIGEDIVDRYGRIFPPDYWAVLPSYAELNGELIDFGIQRNKPWIIQLAERTSRTEALNDLKQLQSFVEFSYISQKREPEDGFRYRTRVGFYETRSDANKMLAEIQSQTGNQFAYAEVLELRHVMENALGQSTGESSLKKLR